MYEWQTVALKGRTVPVGEEFGPEGDAEDLISYTARVSNPANQENFDTAPKLLKWCIKKAHWSVFEMADLIMEINTTRDIGRQILRHRSFNFQEFSQRYAEATRFINKREARLQDYKNRQQSIVTDNQELQDWWETGQKSVLNETNYWYGKALEKGMAKECARAVLPEGLTMSTQYMKGNLRSWFTYSQLRRIESETQREHVDIAIKVWDIVKQEFPFLRDIEVTMDEDKIKEAIKLLESRGYLISGPVNMFVAQPVPVYANNYYTIKGYGGGQSELLQSNGTPIIGGGSLP